MAKQRRGRKLIRNEQVESDNQANVQIQSLEGGKKALELIIVSNTEVFLSLGSL